MNFKIFTGGIRRTPGRLLVGATATLWWLAQPWLVVRYYTMQLDRGTYPSNADSIVIPIGEDWVGWLLFSPVIAMLLVLALRRYEAGAAYAAFDRVRRWRSAAIAVLAVVAAVLVFDSAAVDYQDGYPALALAQLPGLLAVVWLYAGNVRAYGVRSGADRMTDAI